MTDKKLTDEEIIKALHEMWDCSYNYEECQHAEIERLKSRMESDYNAKTKTEAYKEFAEKLKNMCEEIIKQDWNQKSAPVSWAHAYSDFIDDIDNLLKEMVDKK